MIQTPMAESGLASHNDLMALRAMLVDHALFVTRNRADAEDLVQRAFVRAFERRESLDPKTNWHAWFRTVVRRLGIDLARQRRRRQTSATEALDGLVAPNPEPAPAWDWVSAAHLTSALEQCHENYRDILALHYVENLPYTEIAERLQLPMGTVATRLHRGRSMLRKLLESAATLDPDASVQDAG